MEENKAADEMLQQVKDGMGKLVDQSYTSFVERNNHLLMKRMLFFIIVCTCCSTLSWGQATLSVSPTRLTFDGAGGKQTFTITSNTDWEFWDSGLYGKKDWLIVEPLSGSNNGIITVTVPEPYSAIRERTTTLQIRGKNAESNGFIYSSILIIQNTLPLDTTWYLTPTMTAKLKEGIMTVSTTVISEPMPNFSSRALSAFNVNFDISTPPWYDIGIRSHFKKLVIENNVTTIGNGAFFLAAISSVSIPQSVVTIGKSAFEGCWLESSIFIPNSVTTIDERAFYIAIISGSSISISIPKSVTTIGERAFAGNSSVLKDVIVEWSTPLPVPTYTFKNTNGDVLNATLHVPAGTKALYAAAPVWKDFGTIIEYNPTSTESIESQSLTAYASNGILHIAGLQSGEPLTVYSISGQLVYNGIAKAETELIPLNLHGIYIVAVENRSIKVVVD